MPNRLWVYHSEHESKIIIRRELNKYFNAGWKESPAELAGFISGQAEFMAQSSSHHKQSAESKGVSIDDDHARKLAINELGGHTVSFVKQMNKHANDDKWIKEQRDMLESNLKKDFGYDPDMRKYRGYNGMLKLDKLYRELENGNS